MKTTDKAIIKTACRLAIKFAGIEALKEDGWDGYSAKPIDQKMLKDVFRDVSEYLRDFLTAGFEPEDIQIVPVPTGGIQFEAQRDTTHHGRKSFMYMEIEIHPYGEGGDQNENP